MYLNQPFAGDIAKEIIDLKVNENEVVMILLGEQGQTDVDKLIAKLNMHNIEFFGGIFPGLLHGTEVYDSGAIVQILPLLEKPTLIRELDRRDPDIPLFKEEIFDDASKKNTVIILLDGMTERITQLLHRTFNILGNSVNYIGAGAGSFSYEQNPCIFTPEGLFRNAAILAPVKMNTGLGVCHGLEVISGPIIVTKSNGRAIQELNWKNAYEEYKKIIEKAMSREWSDEEFQKCMNHFPFGVYCKDREYVARVITNVTEEGELICQAGVPENAALSVLKSEKEKMILATSKAVKEAIIPETEAKNTLIVDCVGRYKFLDDGFNSESSSIVRELENIDIGVTPEGVLSVGEISSYSEEILEIFNYTVVVGRFYE